MVCVASWARLETHNPWHGHDSTNASRRSNAEHIVLICGTMAVPQSCAVSFRSAGVVKSNFKHSAKTVSYVFAYFFGRLSKLSAALAYQKLSTDLAEGR